MREPLWITEVGLRDGLQNQPLHVPLEGKLELAAALIDAGLRSIEATSFVSAKAVPQMADADLLLPRLQRLPRLPIPQAVRYSVLTPNLRGLERALAAGAREVAVVLSATETMNRRNINMSLDEARAVSLDVVAAAAAQGVRTRGYVAVAFSCPFEGEVAAATVMRLATSLFDAGVDELVIADTVGAASPRQVRDRLGQAVAAFGAQRVAAHFHDTRGFALANAWAALETGVRRFDASVGGLGGCPFAPGAAGNLATEDLVLLAEQCGFDTGIDVARLRAAVRVAERLTQRRLGGRTTAWLETQEAQSAPRSPSPGGSTTFHHNPEE